MLVLQRKKGETLLIGDTIKLSIVDVGADGVKIAIEAPQDVKILREELIEATLVNEEAVMPKADFEKLKHKIL